MKPLEEIVCTNTAICPNKPPNTNNNNLERKLARPQKEQALNCPRCNSTNTKFCYYNNYSLTQPRYFCKTCRRYWTDGGSLRNIPVGGGSRKNKRPSSSSPSPSSSKITTTRLPDLVQPSTTNQPQKMMINQGRDLNLGFPPTTTTSSQDFRNISDLVQLPNINENNTTNKNHNNSIISTSSTTSTTSPSTTSHLSALELLTGLTSRGFNSFMPMPIPDPNTVGFSLTEFKPSLNFSLDGLGSNSTTSGGYANLQNHVQENTSGRLLFPFEDLNQVSSTNTTTAGIIHEQNNIKEGDSSGYWTGMLGGGSW